MRFGLPVAAGAKLVTLLRIERAMSDAGNALMMQGRNVGQTVHQLVGSGLIDLDEAAPAVDFASKLVDDVHQKLNPRSGVPLILARVASGLIGGFFLLASAGGYVSGEPGSATVVLMIALSALAFATRPIWRNLVGPKPATA